ncbi:hypothetical protein [uncultured Erythrobacter sp.]|uniref:hypothetical protein n=1 Tax=uncultured Erythrobacter sp. TaxID=263913 RepID=UPI002605A05A|nr:hypothetical protein [uncultured Erythrobacter sp.]
MSISEEQIAAYADGELEGAALAEVEAAIAADPALARKVAAHRKLKDTLGAHFAPVLDQPVPEHLSALLQPKEDTAPEGEVVSFAAARQKRGLAPAVRRWGVWVGPAMAAAVVAAVVLVPGNVPSDPFVPDGTPTPQLAAALDNQLVASQPADSRTQILLSFENDRGRYCRTYRSGSVGGIACRSEQGWSIEREMMLDGAQATEFRQAGSEGDLLAAAQDMAAGDALDAEAEAEAQAKGWR